MSEYDVLGRDLRDAFARLVVRRHRRRRRLRVAGVVGAAALAFSAVAVASGIGPELQLDPTKWSILGGGSVDEGRGEYVHAQRRDDDGHSTFMVEHDEGMDRYEAFLLHERLKERAAATASVRVRREKGELCARAELTRAEVVALEALRASFAPGTAPDATKARVDEALTAGFAASPCRGLEYAGERARFVYAGIEPVSMLMAGARSR
jgi:hypothetical protein